MEKDVVNWIERDMLFGVIAVKITVRRYDSFVPRIRRKVGA